MPAGALGDYGFWFDWEQTMTEFDKIKVPPTGSLIGIANGKLVVPDDPIIPFIEGDGIGPDISKAAQSVIDASIKKAYGGKKKIVWLEIYAGDKAMAKYGEILPKDTTRAIEHFKVSLKGPLTTPVGGGHRSLNVTLRQVLDLYACVRPVKYIKGVPAPVKYPEKMDMVIFRENTEDVYAGIEWSQGSAEVKKIIGFLKNEMGVNIRQDSGVGIKPISITGSKRLVKKALRYAVEHGRRSVTLVHKGNIMKFTEGSFRDWGYEIALAEFRDKIVTEQEVTEKYNGKTPAGKILVNDRLADSFFQQILTRTDEYDVIATMNLNGDYLSDACAAQVGGLGMAPGANIGDYVGLFEATHGTAPKYAGQDKVNPGSIILSGVMMLEYLGWNEAAELVGRGFERTIAKKIVTYDLARQMEGATEVKTSQFAKALIENM